jgi:hypothetical protein
MRFAIKLSSGLLMVLGLTAYHEQSSLAQTAGGGTGTGAAGSGAAGAGGRGTGSQTPSTAGPGVVGQAPAQSPGQVPTAQAPAGQTPGQAPGGIPTGQPAKLPNNSNFQPGVSQQPSTGGVGLPTAGFNPQPLIMNPQIRQNLALTPQQMNQLTTSQGQLMNTFNTQLQQLQNLTPAEQQARIQALNTQFHTQFGTAANSVLNQTQQQRLQQLMLQQQGFSAFAQPNVQTQLKLTPNQITQLQQKQADFNRQLQLIQQTQDPGRRAQLWAQLRDTGITDLRGVLNQSQFQAWEQMTGQPFGFTFDMMNSTGR